MKDKKAEHLLGFSFTHPFTPPKRGFEKMRIILLHGGVRGGLIKIFFVILEKSKWGSRKPNRVGELKVFKMKRILIVGVFAFLFSSCSQQIYYQLVELESDDIVADGDFGVSSNDEIKVLYDFWSNNGSTSFQIFNKTDRTIYLKHDECQLIKNGSVIDYYDNGEYTSSSSVYKGVTYKRSNLYNSNSYNTPINAIASVLSASATTSATSSSSVARIDKKVLVIPPNSSRAIPGYNLQNARYWDCDVLAKPSNRKSTRENGISFTEDNTPLEFRIFITYSFYENFNEKNTFESSAFLKYFSNWNSTQFIEEKSYKECEKNNWYKIRNEAVISSPLMYYIKYYDSSSKLRSKY